MFQKVLLAVLPVIVLCGGFALAAPIGATVQQSFKQTLSLDQTWALLAGKPLAVGCCKLCSRGKACGNSCISREKSCRKGVGCACD